MKKNGNRKHATWWRTRRRMMKALTVTRLYLNYDSKKKSVKTTIVWFLRPLTEMFNDCLSNVGRDAIIFFVREI